MEPTIAVKIGNRLAQLKTERVVFAESCTGGMAAALMTQVPGISRYFCGSAVTYREPTKISWLKIPSETLEKFTAESQPTTDAMAVAVLSKTPEATIACAITGHLGPDAPIEFDGLVFVTVARKRVSRFETVDAVDHRLASATREDRQREAAEWMLERLELALRLED